MITAEKKVLTIAEKKSLGDNWRKKGLDNNRRKKKYGW